MSLRTEKSPFLNVTEAAEFLRMNRRTLDNLRWMGGGPKFRKHGARVYYRIEDLEAWSKDRELSSTSDE